MLTALMANKFNDQFLGIWFRAAIYCSAFHGMVASNAKLIAFNAFLAVFFTVFISLLQNGFTNVLMAAELHISF